MEFMAVPTQKRAKFKGLTLPQEPLPLSALPAQPPPPPPRIVQGPFRYNPTISHEKMVYSDIKKLLTGLSRNFGLFRATTDAFFTSPQ